MEVRLRHGLVQCFDGIAINGVWWRGDVIRQRLRGAIEEQTHADTGAEHHGYPRKTGEFWLFIIGAQLDATELGKTDIGHDHDGHDHGEVQQPTGVSDSPGESGRRCRRDLVGADNAPNDEADNKNSGDRENYFVDTKAVSLVLHRNTRDQSRVHIVRIDANGTLDIIVRWFIAHKDP